jgi:hypothetical protein
MTGGKQQLSAGYHKLCLNVRMKSAVVRKCSSLFKGESDRSINLNHLPVLDALRSHVSRHNRAVTERPARAAPLGLDGGSGIGLFPMAR